MVNTPIPHSLKSEAKKAAKILRDFSIPNAKSGPDKIIPAGVLMNAEGLAIITVAKIGFLVTARGGSGIVIARLEDRRWSAPSAIGIAGLGGGFEIGAEVTDFVIILNKRSAVEAFSKGGNLTLGGNFTIAAGPLGRNIEGDVSIRSPAAIYTYSKTKGLFAGISIEGSYLVERKDANKKFYREELRANEILSGEVEPPLGCEDLYDILAKHEEIYEHFLDAKAKRDAVQSSASGFMSRARSFRMSSLRRGKKSKSKSSTDVSSGDAAAYDDDDVDRRYGSSYKGSWAEGEDECDSDYNRKSSSKEQGTSVGAGVTRSSSMHLSNLPQKSIKSSSLSRRNQAAAAAGGGGDWDTIPTCEALFSFQGQLPCDLSFHPGDRIEIRTRTQTEDDWWEGVLNGRIGIFPANYVKVL